MAAEAIISLWFWSFQFEWEHSHQIQHITHAMTLFLNRLGNQFLAVVLWIKIQIDPTFEMASANSSVVPIIIRVWPGVTTHIFPTKLFFHLINSNKNLPTFPFFHQTNFKKGPNGTFNKTSTLNRDYRVILEWTNTACTVTKCKHMLSNRSNLLSNTIRALIKFMDSIESPHK